MSFRRQALLCAVSVLAACSGNSVTSAPTLTALTVSAGTLNPAFDPAVTAYSATVPFGTLSVTVTPSTSASSAVTVTQDAGAAVTVASGAASPALTVPARGAQSLINISVAPAGGGGAAVTYTVQLVQADDATASLSSLAPSVGSLSPAFDANTVAYSMTVPNGTTSLKLTPTATDSNVKSISLVQDGGTASTVATGKASAALKIPALGTPSTIVVTVTAQNGYTTQAYTITLTQAGNSDASLASLRASAGTFAPVFASGTTTYTLTVPTGTSTVTLTPTANNTTVHSIVLTANGSSQTIANGAASTALTVPAVGATVNLSLAVTAQDGSSVVTYAIALKQQAANDAALSALSVSVGALAPAFSATTLSYSVSVPFGTSSITVTPTAHDAAHASLAVAQDGGAAAHVNSGSASAALTIPAPGTPTVIAVVVTAQDGTTTQTYSISVTQQSGADDTLASLALSAGTLTPVFAGATHAYTAILPHGTVSFTVTPTSTNALAHSISVAQDGGAPALVASGHASAALSVPAVGATSTISVTVVSQDQANTLTYTVAVSQAASTVSTLSSIGLSDGALRPGFSAAVTSYDVTVTSNNTGLVVTPAATDPAAKSIGISQDGGAAVTIASGSASAPFTIPAAGASTVLRITVTAQNNSTTTYQLTVNRAAATDAALGNLTVSAGTLSPAFASATLAYAVAAPFSVSSITLTPTADSPSAQSIQISQDGGAPVTVASGSPSPALTVPALAVTSNISIVVTAEDGATKLTYTVALTRAAADVDSALASLSPSVGSLSPAFARGTAAYTLSVPFETPSLQLTPTADAADIQSITISQDGGAAQTVASGAASAAFTLPGAGIASVFSIVVTAQSGDTTTYQVTATRAAQLVANIAVSTNNGAVSPGGAATDFGSVQTTTSSSVTFTISNAGTADLSIASATVTSGAADFSITTAPAPTVALGGGSTTFVVKFTPSTAGSRTGSVTITNSSANQPAFVVNLSGTGIQLVTSIIVSAPGSTISTAGGTLQLTAAVSPAGAAQAVTWSSGTPGVATVDGNGLVTAVSSGTSLITATATDGSGISGSLTVTVSLPQTTTAVFVKQTNGTTSATLSGGVITVSSAFGTSGNAFKFVSPNYYGTAANGFVALPTALTGDFTMSATINLTTANKVNTACGIGLGITTGFTPTDRYAYMLMATSGPAVARFVSNATTVGAGSPSVTFALNTPQQVVFNRVGTNLTYGIVGATALNTAGVNNFTDGTTVYASGPVFPAISFNNVVATVTNLLIKDGSGTVLFDSSTGTLSNFAPASLALSASTASVTKGASTTVTATARAPGGGITSANAVAADPTIVNVQVANNATGSVITLNGLKGGNTNVTVTNPSDTNSATNTQTIAVTVNEFSTVDSYGSIAGLVYPAPGAPAAYNEGELSLTFDSPPTLSSGGTIGIYKTADGSLVDSIAYANETQTVNGVTMVVGSQLVRVSGNTVFFTPHFGKLAFGTSYYVAIPTTAISGTFKGGAFAGFSNSNSVATWSFTTRTTPVLTTTVTVDGSQASTANFRTLGGALMFLAANPIAGATAVSVNVAAGTYIELVNYRATSNANLTITISGPAGNARGDNTIIEYTNGGNLNAQNGRASFYFAGANLVLQNLTLKNTGTRAAVAQAEAMYFDSRAGFTFAANNCSFSSNQDTIQTSGRSWFFNSFIEGNTDFIWGIADATLIENSNLRVINDSPGNTYSIFVARTGTQGATTVGKGYVLLHSTVSVDSGILCAFGRDAGTGNFFDQVAVVGNTFTGGGTLAAGLWVTSTAPLSLGDSSYVGWKATGNTGLGSDTAATATGTSATINSVASEYDTRDHIFNRVITVTGTTPVGYQAAATIWDTSALAAAWGAP